jgi:tRNA threonylcarbamoyladenosine biosynthesis protein TsaE
LVSFSYELNSIDQAAQRIILEAGTEKIWVFKGQMGAGKTTMIKSLSRAMGVSDTVSSPTFGIVNEYQTEQGELIFHFDFYRLDDPMEALEIGIEEYFYSGKICWVEWAERIAQFLPENFFLITIESESDIRRKITLQHSQDAY